MLTNIVLDDDLLERAAPLTGVRERTALVREGLTALIQQQTARRLARLGGFDPEATAAPRRCPSTAACAGPSVKGRNQKLRLSPPYTPAREVRRAPAGKGRRTAG